MRGWLQRLPVVQEARPFFLAFNLVANGGHCFAALKGAVQGRTMHAQQRGRLFDRPAFLVDQLAGMVDLCAGQYGLRPKLHASGFGRLAAAPGAVDD